MKRAMTILALAALTAGSVIAADSKGVTGEWPSPVPGWRPLAPGEHPRLVYRQSDLPSLRARAKTPAGKAILAQIETQLKRHPYTTWHAAGYAFLAQMTGDPEHLLKAKEMAELTLSGGQNPDKRYSWPSDGQLRAGPTMWGLALAYDLSYNDWTPEFRKKIADGIMANHFFHDIPNKPRHSPGVNHWGAHSGGMGSTLLALRGDPEVDQKIIEDYFAKVLKNIQREILDGYGNRGYYFEGHHCGRISSNTGIIPFIQAYRVAAGKDLVANCENAQWLSAKWIYELFPMPGGTPGNMQRGMYCRAFGRGGDSGLSENADITLGFGIIPDKYKPAFLWTYNNVVCPGDKKDYDVLGMAIHGVYAFVNWPFDMKEQNPGEVLPNILHDSGPDYFVFRNGWKGDGSDLVVSALIGSKPSGGRGMAVGGSVYVGGRGLKAGNEEFFRFPGMFHTSKLTYSRLAKDGSAVISARWLDPAKPPAKLPDEPTSLAVDFSKAAGVDLLVAMTGPQIGHNVEYWMQIAPIKAVKEVTGSDGWQTRTVRMDVAPDGVKQPWYVMTLQKGDAPKVTAADNTITVGKQTLKFDGEKIILGTMGPELNLSKP